MTLASVTSSLSQMFTAGVNALGGTFGATSMAASLGGVGTGAVSAAVGSIVSQAVGVGIGAQDSFSWKNVALAAIGGGAAGGLQGDLLGTTSGTFANAVVRSAVGNVVSQGIGVATGLQSSFSWKGVVASAVGAGVGHLVSEGLGIIDDKGMRTEGFKQADFGTQLFKSTAAGLAAGTATAVMRGGRVSVQQIAVDAFGNALGESIAGGMSKPSEQEDKLGDFIGEQVAAQERRDRYGFGSMASGQGLKAGGAYGFQPSASSVFDWSSDIGAGISANAASMSSGALTAEELALRTSDVEQQIQLEIAGQEAREESLQGAQMFRTAGARNGGRGGIGSGGFEMVRNGNWDAALNIGADGLGILGEVPGLQQDLAKLNKLQAEERINDMRQRMNAAGMKNVPTGFTDALVAGSDGMGRTVRDYGATVDDLKNRYEGFVRDNRLRETWGDGYQTLTLAKSKMTVMEFEKRVLDMQQQATDRAYAKGVEAIARGELTVKDGDYARVLGSYVDLRVRNDLRGFAKSEGINDSMASNLWGVNRSIRSDLAEGRGIPDNRLGYNLFADTTLARKNGYTEQIMKWNAIRPDANYLVIRPTNMPGGGSYAIPRTAIQPFNPARPVGRSL